MIPKDATIRIEFNCPECNGTGIKRTDRGGILFCAECKDGKQSKNIPLSTLIREIAASTEAKS